MVWLALDYGWDWDPSPPETRLGSGWLIR